MKLIDAITERLAWCCAMMTLAAVALVSPDLVRSWIDKASLDDTDNQNQKGTDYDTHIEK